MEFLKGDCAKILPELGTEFVDLIVTHPPYDYIRTFDDKLKWDFSIFADIARGMEAVLKPGGIIVWVVNDGTIKGSRTGTCFEHALFFKNELKMRIFDIMIWRRPNPKFCHAGRYVNCYDYMMVFSKGKPRVANIIKDKPNKFSGSFAQNKHIRLANGKYADKGFKKKRIAEFGVRHNIWDINAECGHKMNPERGNHPATFALQVATDHIRSWSNPGEIVLDPFMGSGTVGVACAYLDRQFIGIEINGNYIKAAKKRISMHSKKAQYGRTAG